MQYYETKKDATSRKEKENSKIATGVKQKRDHVGNENAYLWEAEECLREVSGYQDGDVINYSQLAKKYNMKNKHQEYPQNGGQIVKEYLVNNGIDVSKFEPAVKRRIGIRRAIRRYANIVFTT